MKHLLIALFALALPLCAADVTVTFDFNFTMPTCSTTVAANCDDHFESGILLPAAAINSLVSIPIPANASGKVAGITGHFKLLAYGQTEITAIMVGKDGNGNRITSDPLKCTVTITLTPASPTNPMLVARAIGPTFPPNPWEG